MPSEALRQFLSYMENFVRENALNEELREIHRMVETVKRDPEVTGMRIKLVDDVIRLTEENERISEESERKTEQISKLFEENMRLREELAQKRAAERQPTEN